MKTFVSFGFSVETERFRGPQTLPSNTIEQIREKWPGTKLESRLFIEGDADSESVSSAIKLARQFGKSPKLEAFPSFGRDYSGPLFFITAKRIYSREDAVNYEYFRFSASDKLAEEDIYRLPDGTREKYIEGKKISKRFSFGFAGPNNWACKTSARAELEAEGFVGLDFEEMPQKPVSKPYEPIFRPISTVTLPPVLNPLYNEDGELCQGDFSRGCVRDNSIVSGLPLYYDETAVRAMEPFDCAWSAEAFGGVHWRNRALIVSKRFLEYCWGRGWNCDFVPAILRPDGVAPPLEPLFPWLEELKS